MKIELWLRRWPTVAGNRPEAITGHIRLLHADFYAVVFRPACQDPSNDRRFLNVPVAAKPMHETGHVLIASVVTWLARFLIVPVTEIDLELWKLIVSATVGGIYGGLLVLLGESVI